MRKSITFWKHALFSGGNSRYWEKNLCFAKRERPVDREKGERQEVLKAYGTGRGRTRKCFLWKWDNEISNRVSLFKRPDIVKLKENLSSSVHLESSLWRLVYTEKFYCCLLRTIQRKSFWPDMIQVPVLNLWRQEQEKSVAI